MCEVLIVASVAGQVRFWSLLVRAYSQVRCSILPMHRSTAVDRGETDLSVVARKVCFWSLLVWAYSCVYCSTLPMHKCTVVECLCKVNSVCSV